MISLESRYGVSGLWLNLDILPHLEQSPIKWPSLDSIRYLLSFGYWPGVEGLDVIILLLGVALQHWESYFILTIGVGRWNESEQSYDEQSKRNKVNEYIGV